MKYVRLGKSGLKVSRVSNYPSSPNGQSTNGTVLGCMSYGSDTWQKWVLNEDKALPLLKAAWDHGITTWDTANAYSNVRLRMWKS